MPVNLTLCCRPELPLEKDRFLGPSENNYSQISGDKSWASPRTLKTGTRDPNPVLCIKHLNFYKKLIQRLPELGEEQLIPRTPNYSLHCYTFSSTYTSVVNQIMTSDY